MAVLISVSDFTFLREFNSKAGISLELKIKYELFKFPIAPREVFSIPGTRLPKEIFLTLNNNSGCFFSGFKRATVKALFPRLKLKLGFLGVNFSLFSNRTF